MPRKVISRALPADAHVGKRIRQLRKAAGLTQEKLAGDMGISFQQLQKYESAANRISASRLLAAAMALDVSPAAFFEGLEGASIAIQPPWLTEFLSEEGATEVAIGYTKLSPSQQTVVTAMIAAMARQEA